MIGIRARRIVIAAVAAIALGIAAAGRVLAAPTHPLDPLTADELATIAAVLKHSERFSPSTNFAWIQLQEPDKRVVQAFKPGADFPRQASLTAIDFAAHKTFAVVVDVKAARIASVTDLDGLQPGLTDADTGAAKAILDADPRVKAALLARGLKVPGKASRSVTLEFAPIGHDPDLVRQGGRLVRCFFASDQHAVNAYGPFLDGLMAVVDLYSKAVVKLVDEPGVARLLVPHDIFSRKVRGASARNIPVSRAERGARTFAVAGNLVRWHDWTFRYGFNLREGLVLYQLAFGARGHERSILYRASVSEVVTAYGDASDFWSWLELFDESVFGLGASAAQVQAGREVPANALVLDPLLPDPARPRFAARPEPRLYIYERPAGSLMYFQQDDLTFHAGATELVIGFVASLGNYAYGFDWVFRQDGSFAFEVDLAGEVLTKFVRQRTCDACKAIAGGPGPDGASRTYTATGDERYGTLVYPNLVAANHQHWFNLRLDFDIDGTANAVMENNLTHADPEPQGADARADGRAFAASHTVFGQAAQASRDMNDATSRSWTIYNPSAVNDVGRAAGYTIMPMANAMTIFPPQREQDTAGFTFHHFWVTPYRPAQLYAAGAYPNQAGAGYADKLYHYADSDSVYDKDIVVWYSLGMTHFPRAEDYPIMPNERLSVAFRPDGFFARNPALGLGRVSGH